MRKYLLGFIPLFILLFLPLAVSAQGGILINEIAWMGTETSAYDEWIELYNSGSEEIDLTGWLLVAKDGQPSITSSGTIASHAYFLLERSDDSSVIDISANQIYTGALGNDGEELELRDADGILIDFIYASSSWPGGDNATKQTLERTTDLIWQTSADVGGTPGVANSQDEPEVEASTPEEELPEEEPQPEEETSEDEGSGGTTQIIIPQHSLGDILINEFVSDPAGDDNEWVELINMTNSPIDLAGWYIEEGAGRKTQLSGEVGAIGGERFLVINNITGNLNNGGDVIYLYDNSDNLIDRIGYGNWENNDSNAPVVRDPQSVARVFDGYNTFNNHNDFKITANPTKGTSNIIFSIDEEIFENNDWINFDYGTGVIISEILPNPVGSDDGEFIELYNGGENSVRLVGWTLKDRGGKIFEFGDGVIEANDYLVVFRTQTKIALNNSGDDLFLIQPLRDEALSAVSFSSAKEGEGYNYDVNSDKWYWGDDLTPGAINHFEIVNNPPQIEFSFGEPVLAGRPVIFDSSDTFDEDGNVLTYFWEFGDGISNTLSSPEHTYFKEGVYEVSLLVSDGENERVLSRQIEVHEDVIVAGMDNIDTTLLQFDVTQNIIINEILPNPIGSDIEGEFIELKNIGMGPVNIYGWIIDDGEGGSSPYRIDENIILDMGELLGIFRGESKIAFNNTSDSARIFNINQDLIDEIYYSDPTEGHAYALSGTGAWEWTDEPTPGRENSINNYFDYYEYADEDIYPIYSPLENISSIGVDEEVLTKGVVAVLPGVLGVRYFYIVEGSRGIQIYSHKKEFPDLKIGDLVNVKGEYGIAYGEERIKISTRENITVLDGEFDIIFEYLTADEIGDEFCGGAVSVEGEIVEKSGSGMLVDDGTGEVEIYIKKYTDIVKKDYSKSDTISIRGILSCSKWGMRLFPRSAEDMVGTGNMVNENGVEVLGETNIKEWSIPVRDKKTALLKYYVVVVFSIFVISGAFYFKYHRK